MISVVMPAHNEAQVIGRTLSALTKGALPGEMEVIVVCNGCTDDTAAVARAFDRGSVEAGDRTGDRVRVLETSVPSKIKALNLGDQTAVGFPRIYIDADVQLPIDVLRQLARCLECGPVLAAAPRPSIEVSGCPWSVRAYYDINSRLPSSHEGIGGSGVYALSQRGRARFGTFPDITADDGYVRIQFTPEERKTLMNCSSVVFAPKKLKDLIAIKTRSHFGNYELHARFPTLWTNKGASNHGALLRLWRNPLLWAKLALYCYVKLIARMRARRRFRQGLTQVWERDESSRQAAFSSAAERS
jgi:glycosyltransferase involved in cell wall biosynthesis